MIVYADSSVLVRAYLKDEQDHADARVLLEDRDISVVSGSWTRIEVAGALTRAARNGRVDKDAALEMWDRHTGSLGVVTLMKVPQEDVEERAFAIVTQHGLCAMDAWHVAAASLTVPRLADGEPYAFATRDDAQAEVAQRWGFARFEQ